MASPAFPAPPSPGAPGAPGTPASPAAPAKPKWQLTPAKLLLGGAPKAKAMPSAPKVPKSSPEHYGSGSEGEASSSSCEPGEIRRKAPSRKAHQLTPTQSTATPKSANRFAALADAMDADEEEEENHDDLSPAPSAPAKKIKPPPIFVPDVSDIGGFITDVALAIGSLKFEYKSGTDGRVRVNLEDKESFSKLKSYLNENEIRYQTFQAKDERAYRIVVKGLHHSMNIDLIKEALAEHGHT
ncbi:hypothetical protein ACLKA7_004889, partial [Drosophila subpalustris]